MELWHIDDNGRVFPNDMEPVTSSEKRRSKQAHACRKQAKGSNTFDPQELKPSFPSHAVRKIDAYYLDI